MGRMDIFGIQNRRRSEKENILEKEFCVCGRKGRRESREVLQEVLAHPKSGSFEIIL